MPWSGPDVGGEVVVEHRRGGRSPFISGNPGWPANPIVSLICVLVRPYGDLTQAARLAVIMTLARLGDVLRGLGGEVARLVGLTA
jgi:hypothetical protein